MIEEFQYKVEPTGVDSPSRNGQVERYNDTIATIIQTLLYMVQIYLPSTGLWQPSTPYAYSTGECTHHMKHGGVSSQI
jgi:hypothetical protein